MIRALKLFLTVGSLVLTVILVAAVFAADQPAAEKPQMVRFVTQFIVFSPKDPSVLGDNSDPNTEYPRLGLANSNPQRPYGVKTPEGYWFQKGLEELVPTLGPFDALKSQDPGVVEKALTRMDDQWNYHVLSLWTSGPVGDILLAHGTAGPFPVMTADGHEAGRGETVRWKVTRGFGVGKLLDGGTALVQSVYVIETFAEWGDDMWTGKAGVGARRVGAVLLEGGQSAGVHPYRTASGDKLARVIHPGFLLVDTIELGEWPKAEAPEGPQPGGM